MKNERKSHYRDNRYYYGARWHARNERKDTPGGNAENCSRSSDLERTARGATVLCASSRRECAVSLTNCILMHKGVPLISLFCPREATLSPEKRSRPAIHAYVSATVLRLTDQGALFREVKDTSRGSCLKCIGSVLSNRFILAVPEKSSGGRTSDPPEEIRTRLRERDEGRGRRGRRSGDRSPR